MTRDEIIRAIVDRTIEAARAGTIPPYVTEAATYAAHLAFDAALEEAAEIADAVSRHFAGLAEEWRPIETAPKDGTPILLYRRGQYTGYYGGADSGWRFNDPLKTGMWPLPTHWHPLPPPPKEAEQ